MDELDRAAFSVLLPDIRDHFGMTDAAALSLVGATAIAIVLLEVPLAFLADRRNRVRIAATGAAIWAVFSAATGLAVSVGMLALARVGAGGGKAVVTPTHSSLLADYYVPAAACEGLLRPPARQLRRPDHGAGSRRRDRRALRVAGTVPALRHS